MVMQASAVAMLNILLGEGREWIGPTNNCYDLSNQSDDYMFPESSVPTNPRPRTDSTYSRDLDDKERSRANMVCHGRGFDPKPPCPQMQECLDYAIRTHSDSGVWGGMTQLERRVYIKERRHLKVVLNA